VTTTTRVWENDVHDISWRVTSSAGTVDLAGATVRLVSRLRGGATADLACSAVGDVVTHTLTGDLAVGTYDLIIEATRDGDTVTYPDATAGPVVLEVRRDVG